MSDTQQQQQHPTLEGYTTSLIEQKKKQRRHWKQLKELLERQQRDQLNQHYLISYFQQINLQISLLSEQNNKLLQTIQLRKQYKVPSSSESSTILSFFF